MVDAKGAGGVCGDGPVGVVQPLVQQGLQLAHVLERQVQGLKSSKIDR